MGAGGGALFHVESSTFSTPAKSATSEPPTLGDGFSLTNPLNFQIIKSGVRSDKS